MRPASGRAGLTVADVLRGRSHDGQVGAVGQHLQRHEDQVLFDPPGQVGAGGAGQVPQFVPGEVAVGQQEHVRSQGGQQPAGELVLAELGHRVEGHIDQGMGSAFGQGHQADLRVSALVDTTLAREAELSCVRRGVGDVQRGAVPGDQPQPEGERARSEGCGQRAAPPLEQCLQRFVAQPLPGSCQGRAGGQALHAQARQVPQLLGQRAQNRPVSRRTGTVGAAEQA